MFQAVARAVSEAVLLLKLAGEATASEECPALVQMEFTTIAVGAAAAAAAAAGFGVRRHDTLWVPGVGAGHP